jgi:hypothetical protein
MQMAEAPVPAALRIRPEMRVPLPILPKRMRWAPNSGRSWRTVRLTVWLVA